MRLLIPLSDLNRYPLLDFVRVLFPLFSGAPWIPALAHAQRPFANLDELQGSLSEVIASAEAGTKELLIQQQLDPLALSMTLPRAERTAALALANEEKHLLKKMQFEYHRKFGFPLVVSIAAEMRDNLFFVLRTRLENTREQEITNALDEIDKLTRFRLREMVSERG